MPQVTDKSDIDSLFEGLPAPKSASSDVDALFAGLPAPKTSKKTADQKRQAWAEYRRMILEEGQPPKAEPYKPIGGIEQPLFEQPDYMKSGSMVQSEMAQAARKAKTPEARKAIQKATPKFVDGEPRTLQEAKAQMATGLQMTGSVIPEAVHDVTQKVMSHPATKAAINSGAILPPGVSDAFRAYTKTNPDVVPRVVGHVAEVMPYVLPGLSQAMIASQAAQLGGMTLEKGPIEAGAEAWHAVSPFESNLDPEERAIRALGLVAGISHGLNLGSEWKMGRDDAAITKSLMAGGMTEAQAQRTIHLSRVAINEGYGDAIEGKVRAAVDQLKKGRVEGSVEKQAGIAPERAKALGTNPTQAAPVTVNTEIPARENPDVEALFEGLPKLTPKVSTSPELAVKPKVEAPVKAEEEPIPAPVSAATPPDLTLEQQPRKVPETPVPVKPELKGKVETTVEATKTKVPEPVKEEPTVVPPVVETTGISNRMQSGPVERGDINLPEKGEVKSKSALHEQAKGTTLHEAESLSKSVENGTSRFTPENVAKFKEGDRQFWEERKTLGASVDEAIAKGDTEAAKRLGEEYADLKRRHQEYLDRVQKGKTEWHNVGKALQDALVLDTGDYAHVAREVRRAQGHDLTVEQERRIRELTDRVQKIEAENEHLQNVAKEHEKRASDLEAQRILKSVGRQERGAARATKIEKLRAERADIGKQLAQLSSKLSANPLLETAEGVQLVGKLVRNIAEEGVAHLGELVDRVNEFVTEHGHKPLSDREVFDALTGAGRKTKAATPSEAALNVRTLKAQAQLISKINDAIKGVEQPGRAKIVPEPVIQGLRQALRDIKKQTATAKLTDKTAGLTNAIEEALDTLEYGKPEPKVKVPDTPEVQTLRKQLADIRKQIKDKYGDPKKAPVLLKKRIEAYEKRIATAEERMATKSRALKKSEPKDPQVIADAKAKLNDIRQRMKVEDQISEYQRQLREKDFPKKKERTPGSDALEAKRAERDRARARVLEAIEQARPKTAGEKFGQLQQMNILSSPTVFGKLLAATAGHAAISPIEEGLGHLLGVAVPGLRKAAGTELRGNWKAEGRALTELFRPETWKDAVHKLTTGHNSLNERAIASGLERAGENTGNKLLRYIRNSHGAVKTPLQRAAFQREYVKQMTEFERQGKAIGDAEREEAFAGAYAASQRAILMNPNEAATAIRNISRGFRKKGRGGDAAAAFINSLMPIVRVPTNYAGRALEYQVGIPYAAVKALLHKGEMTPEAAGAIARALKRGGVGAGLMVVGGMASKKDLSTDKHGNLVIHGETLPSWATHIPFIQSLKMGVMIRDLGVRHEAIEGGIDTIKHTPAASTATDVAFALMGAKGAEKAAGNYVRGVLIPQPLQQFARAIDPAGKRVTEGFGGELSTGLPGETFLGIPARESLRPKK